MVFEHRTRDRLDHEGCLGGGGLLRSLVKGSMRNRQTTKTVHARSAAREKRGLSGKALGRQAKKGDYQARRQGRQAKSYREDIPSTLERKLILSVSRAHTNQTPSQAKTVLPSILIRGHDYSQVHRRWKHITIALACEPRG